MKRTPSQKATCLQISVSSAGFLILFKLLYAAGIYATHFSSSVEVVTIQVTARPDVLMDVLLSSNLQWAVGIGQT